jgi:4,5-dihydroxyphthalate decarboxylase
MARSPRQPVRVACNHYDRTIAAIQRLVTSDKPDIDVVETPDLIEMFIAMHEGKYDASEFSFGEMVYQTSREAGRFIAVPVFPLRMFRHSAIFVNASSGIQGPEDLDGKKVALYRVAQTTCIWIRGMLKDEYGVSPKIWYAPSIHHWDDEAERAAIRARDGSTVEWLDKRDGKTTMASLDEALREGEIDALCSAAMPPSFVKGDSRVRRLFENYDEVERDYFYKTKIFPIMHVIAVRKPVAEKHPDLPAAIFRLFSKAKKWSRDWIAGEGRVGLLWKDAYLEKERRLFPEHPWSYGFGQNRRVIEKFLGYCYDQGVSARRLTAEELFAPSTRDLKEE